MKFIRHLLTCALIGAAFGQMHAQGTLSGNVKDETGETVIGASVSVMNTQLGAATDLDGNYEVGNIPAGNHEIEVSYIGYLSQKFMVTIKSGQTTKLDATLQPDVKVTDEVVVVGYGVQRKRDLIGSVTKVEGESDMVGQTFQTVLQGKATGVQVTQTSGVAGAGAVVRIRGIGSLSADGDPLYVVDGIPINNNNFQLGNNSAQNANPLSFINPNDIESIEVLKDASAAAIYGSRGANGVVIVTTKRGKKNGKLSINYGARLGVTKETNRIKLLNAQDWLAVRQEAWENDGNAGRAPLPMNLTYEDIEGIDTDWLDQILRAGFQQEHNVSLNWGTKKFSTYVGLNYTNADSYIKSNNFERISGRANFDYRPMDNLTISLNTSLARSVTKRVGVAWAGTVGWAQQGGLPIFPVTYDPLIENATNRGDLAAARNYDSLSNIYGGYFRYDNFGDNVLAQVDYTGQRVFEWRSVNNVNVVYSPIKQLTFTAQGGLEYQKLGEFYLTKPEWIKNANTQDFYSSQYQQHGINYNVYGTATYNFEKILPKNHNLSLMAGAEYQRNDYKRDIYQNFRGVEDYLYNNPAIDTAGGTDFLEGQNLYQGTDRSISKEQFLSYFSRLNYNFNEKLYFQATVRADASSKFPTKHQWAVFPAVGVGYILSEESFLKDNKVINFLKFKASWGLRGVAGIPTLEQFPAYSIIESTGGTVINGYNNSPERYQTKLGNPNLIWDKNSTYDVGFEIGLFDDRLTADITYYHSRTFNAVIKTKIQASAGIDNVDFFLNQGIVRNTGIEIGLKSKNLVGKFQWSTTLNLAHNSNVLESVGVASPDALDGGYGDQRAIPGYPVGTSNLVRYSRVDPTTGRVLYLDRDGNETTEFNISRDRVPVGGVLPVVVGGLINEFKWKNWDLSFMFYGSFGGYIYEDDAKRMRAEIDFQNKRQEVLDRWRQEGDETKFPRYSTLPTNSWGMSKQDDNNSTLWLEKADYVRLRTLTIGYRIPIKSKFINSARVFFSGNNLATFTGYTGWDPEVARDREGGASGAPQQRNIGGTNVTYLTPPQAMSFIFGLDFGF